jgi:AcrR family transcriptional regulator
MAKKKRAYHHGNLRQALIDIGLKIVAEKGVRALTLRELGTRAGVSRMAAYRHFANKHDLVFAISEAGFEQFANVLTVAKHSAPPDFASRMSAMAVAYVRFANEHRPYYDVMFSAEELGDDTQAPPDSAGARAFAVLVDTLREGQESGDVRAGDPVTLARFVWSVVHGASTLQLARDTAFTRLCSELIRTGLAPR